MQLSDSTKYVLHMINNLLLRNPFARRTLTLNSASIQSSFHSLYYDSGFLGGTWADTRWLGVQTLKCPLDLWEYQETLFELKPDFIIESGSAHGGSALYFASLCDIFGKGKVISIDVEGNRKRPVHERITYLTGPSTSPSINKQVKELVGGARSVIVILDSDHHKDYVLREMDSFKSLVTKGSYLVVEDTNLGGHPVFREFGPGPMEAVKEFLKFNPDFKADPTREKHLLTFFPSGWLKRMSDPQS